MISVAGIGATNKLNIQCLELSLESFNPRSIRKLIEEQPIERFQQNGRDMPIKGVRFAVDNCVDCELMIIRYNKEYYPKGALEPVYTTVDGHARLLKEGLYLLLRESSKGEIETAAELDRSEARRLTQIRGNDQLYGLFPLSGILKLGLKKKTKSPYVEVSSIAEIPRFDRWFKTERGTTYYFRGQDVVGFSKNNRLFRFFKPFEDSKLPFASHAAILQRMGVDIESLNPMQQVQVSREYVRNILQNGLNRDAALKKRWRQKINSLTQSVLRHLRSGRKPRSKTSEQILYELIHERVFLHYELMIGDLKQRNLIDSVDNTPTDLEYSGNNNNVRSYRFIWLKNLSFNHSLVFSNEDITHGALTEIALGKDITNEFIASGSKNKLGDQFRGGIFEVKYKNGRAVDVRLPREIGPEARRASISSSAVSGKVYELDEMEVLIFEELLKATLRIPN